MEKIDFNKHRNLSEIVRASIQFITSEGKNLLKFYIRFLLVFFIPIAFLIYNSDLFAIGEIIREDITKLKTLLPSFDLKRVLLAGIAQVFAWLVFLSITLVYIRNYCTPNAKPLSNKEMWEQLFYEFPKLFIVQFLYIGLFVFGLFSFILPGIYFGVSLALAATIVIFEDVGISQGTRSSIKLTRSKWFMSLGYLLIFYLMYLVARTLLQLPVSLIGTSLSSSGELSKIGFTIVSTLDVFLNIFSSIFPILGSAFLYFTLKQQEDNSKT